MGGSGSSHLNTTILALAYTYDCIFKRGLCDLEPRTAYNIRSSENIPGLVVDMILQQQFVGIAASQI